MPNSINTWTPDAINPDGVQPFDCQHEIEELKKGGGGGVLVCNIDLETYTLDKTAGEIFQSSFAVLLVDQGGAVKSYAPMDSAVINVEGYGFSFVAFGENEGGEAVIERMQFVAATEDDYPTLPQG